MNAYQPSQEWNNLRWGTVMPITVMIGSKLVQLRAWGSCSVAGTDPARLEEKVPDPDNLVAYVKSLLLQTFTDMLAERSGEVSDVAQLTATILPCPLPPGRFPLESIDPFCKGLHYLPDIAILV